MSDCWQLTQVLLCQKLEKLVEIKTNLLQKQQEFSYRKQITRQVHTQYVEVIYRPKYYTVTLKCRLRKVTGNGTIDRSYTTYY